MSTKYYDKSELIHVFGPLASPNRLYYPSIEQATDEEITKKFSTLRGESASVTLVDGAFDVPHPNHEHYLRHCRLLGAQALLEAQSLSVNEDNLRKVISSNAVKLVVTLDADEWIDKKKSNDPLKGGIRRPIYPWPARASRLAGYSFDIGYGVRNTVDLVTVERDFLHLDTPLESHLHLAKFLKEQAILDNLVVFGEHDMNVSAAEELGLDPLVINDNGAYEINPQTDEPYSSSEIIARINGRVGEHAYIRPDTMLQ